MARNTNGERGGRDGATALLAAGLAPAVREALLVLLGGDPTVLAAFLDAMARSTNGAPFLSPKETRLGIKRARELCASGELKAYRVAGRWLIDRDDYMRWVREHDERAVREAPAESEENPLDSMLAAKGVRLKRAG